MFGWICDKLIYMSVTKMFNLKVVFLLNSANTIWCVFSVCEKSEDFFVWNCFMSEIKYSHKWSSEMSLSRKWKSDLFRNKRKPGTKKNDINYGFMYIHIYNDSCDYRHLKQTFKGLDLYSYTVHNMFSDGAL